MNRNEVIMANEHQKTEVQKHIAELNKMRIRLVAAVILAGPLLYIAVAHVLPLGLPYPVLIDPYLNPTGSTSFTLILSFLFILACIDPILYGLRALRKKRINIEAIISIAVLIVFSWGVVIDIMVRRGYEYLIWNPPMELSIIILVFALIWRGVYRFSHAYSKKK